jgi:putative nucleotidyltransferase with HDIG domain
MSVHVIADNRGKLSELRSMLAPHHDVHPALLSDGIDCSGFDAAVISADLRVVDNLSALKKILPALKRARRRIFLIEQKAHLSVVQAYALGATCVLFDSANLRGDLLAELARSGTVSERLGAKHAASTAATALAAMFLSVRAGKQLDVEGAELAAGTIADSIADDGLTVWLDTVRRHHEGTYQHCLLVTGVAVDFGLSLGLSGADIRRLNTAAMFHDIGKAHVPLAVLDKPGQLDARERALIETHPVIGYDVLKVTDGISPEVLDAVRHHHEYLDGSGYPDGLCAESISDVVRILTIADIFAALIENRSYRPQMPREKAYDIICNMHGKLEKPLVAAFRDVALKR